MASVQPSRPEPLYHRDVPGRRDPRQSRSWRAHKVRIEDRSGDSLPEATVTVDDQELIDLLQGLADVIEDKRNHLHFAHPGGPQLVVRRAVDADADPLRKQMDWWLGPAVLFGALFLVVGLVTFVRWAVGLVS